MTIFEFFANSLPIIIILQIIMKSKRSNEKFFHVYKNFRLCEIFTRKAEIIPYIFQFCDEITYSIPQNQHIITFFVLFPFSFLTKFVFYQDF